MAPTATKAEDQAATAPPTVGSGTLDPSQVFFIFGFLFAVVLGSLIGAQFVLAAGLDSNAAAVVIVPLLGVGMVVLGLRLGHRIPAGLLILVQFYGGAVLGGAVVLWVDFTLSAETSFWIVVWVAGALLLLATSSQPMEHVAWTGPVAFLTGTALTAPSAVAFWDHVFIGLLHTPTATENRNPFIVTLILVFYHHFLHRLSLPRLVFTSAIVVVLPFVAILVPPNMFALFNAAPFIYLGAVLFQPHGSRLLSMIGQSLHRVLGPYIKAGEASLLSAVSVTFVFVMCADNDKVGLSTTQMRVTAATIFIVTAILMAIVMLQEEPKEQYSQCARDRWADPMMTGATIGLAVAGFAFVASMVVTLGFDAVVMATFAGASVTVVKVVDGPKLAELLLDSFKIPSKKMSSLTEPACDNGVDVVGLAVVGVVVRTAMLAGTETMLLWELSMLVSVALTVASLVKEGGILSEINLMDLVVIAPVQSTIPGNLQSVMAPLFTGHLVSKMQIKKSTVLAAMVGIGLTTAVTSFGHLLELGTADLEVLATVIVGLTSVAVAVTAGGMSGVFLGFMVGSRADYFNDDTNSLTLRKVEAVGAACDSISMAEIAAELAGLEAHSVTRFMFTTIPGLVGVLVTVTGLLDTFYYARATVVVCAEILIMVLWGYKDSGFPGVKTASCLFGLSVGVEWAQSKGQNSLMFQLFKRVTSSSTTGVMTLVPMLLPAVGDSSYLVDTVVLLVMGFMLVVHQLINGQETCVPDVTVTRHEKPVASLRQLAAGECVCAVSMYHTQMNENSCL